MKYLFVKIPWTLLTCAIKLSINRIIIISHPNLFGGKEKKYAFFPPPHYNLICCLRPILSMKYCAEGWLLLGLKKFKYFDINQANK